MATLGKYILWLLLLPRSVECPLACAPMALPVARNGGEVAGNRTSSVRRPESTRSETSRPVTETVAEAKKDPRGIGDRVVATYPGSEKRGDSVGGGPARSRLLSM